MIHRICIFRNRHAQFGKIRHTFHSVIMIDNISIKNQKNHIERQKDLRWWLMDCCYNCSSFTCQSVQKLDQIERCCRIQTCCRFVQENQRRINQQLDSDRCSFSLTARNTSDKCISDISLSTSFESKGNNHAFNKSILFFTGLMWEPHIGDKPESLSRSKSW